LKRWILLRGWTREARHWGEFPVQLGAALPDSEVVAIDLPGTGALHRETSPASVERIVERCRSRLQELGLAAPFNLLGLSLGAMTSLAWCRRHPGEVEACVLINPSTRTFSPFHHRLRPASYAAIAGALLEREPQRREAAIFALTSSRPADASVAARWAEFAASHPVTRANAARQLVAAARYRAALAPPAVPLLLLASGGDRLVDPRCSLELARHWALECRVHPGAGHDLPLDDGEWVAAEVGRWLRPS
jgi:pimeloyl-ACP methyl ester carboxylesterase